MLCISSGILSIICFLCIYLLPFIFISIFNRICICISSIISRSYHPFCFKSPLETAVSKSHISLTLLALPFIQMRHTSPPRFLPHFLQTNAQTTRLTFHFIYFANLKIQYPLKSSPNLSIPQSNENFKENSQIQSQTNRSKI